MPHKDPEVRKAYMQAYRSANKERLAELNAQWRANNVAYQQEYRAKTIEQQRARDRKRYPKRREQQLAYLKEYRVAHHVETKSYSALRRGATYADLTTEQWNAVLASYNHRCAYCGCQHKKLEIDHITPVTKDGAHTLHNVVPACHACNNKKRQGPPLKPVQPLLL